MKNKYYFILGNNKALSLAEIMSLFKIDPNRSIIADNFLIAEIDEEINANNLMSILGGTIKVGSIISEYPSSKFKLTTKKLIENIKTDKDKKFYFGFSQYGKTDETENNHFTKIGMKLKNELKKQNIKSRMVSSKEEELSSVIVKKNKLISDQGIEWCILKDKEKTYLGKTLVVQEFENYSKRDFGRPARDTKSGMIPPKLARIMINLVRSNINDTNLILLDPFCGSGTIMQEAAMLKIKNIQGSDLSETTIKDATQNLNWLQEQVDWKINWQVNVYDVQTLSQLTKKESIDLIVTEPCLGPPLLGGESEENIDKIINKLSILYLNALKEFKNILKPKGKICMIWPVFLFQNRLKFLPIENQVQELGFNKINLFDTDFKKNNSIRLSDRDTIIYNREGQKVYREILLFTKQ